MALGKTSFEPLSSRCVCMWLVAWWSCFMGGGVWVVCWLVFGWWMGCGLLVFGGLVGWWRSGRDVGELGDWVNHHPEYFPSRKLSIQVSRRHLMTGKGWKRLPPTTGILMLVFTDTGGCRRWREMAGDGGRNMTTPVAVNSCSRLEANNRLENYFLSL